MNSISSSESTEFNLIKIKGNFTFSNYEEFVKTYRELENYKNFIVDLTDTDFLDSSALGMLLMLREFCKTGGDGILLRIKGDTIKKQLDIANFAKIFKIESV